MPKRVWVNPLYKQFRGRWCIARTWRGNRALFKIVSMGMRRGRSCLSDVSHEVFLARLSVGKSVGKFEYGHHLIMGGLLLPGLPSVIFQATESLAGISAAPLNLVEWDPPAARVLRAWRESKLRLPPTEDVQRQVRLGDFPREVIESIAVYTAVACQDEIGDIVKHGDPEADLDDEAHNLGDPFFF